MTIQALSERGQSNRELAQLLGVTEGAVRYHRRRREAGAGDGRARQAFLARAWHDAITAWLEATEQKGAGQRRRTAGAVSGSGLARFRGQVSFRGPLGPFRVRFGVRSCNPTLGA